MCVLHVVVNPLPDMGDPGEHKAVPTRGPGPAPLAQAGHPNQLCPSCQHMFFSWTWRSRERAPTSHFMSVAALSWMGTIANNDVVL